MLSQTKNGVLLHEAELRNTREFFVKLKREKFLLIEKTRKTEAR